MVLKMLEIKNFLLHFFTLSKCAHLPILFFVFTLNVSCAAEDDFIVLDNPAPQNDDYSVFSGNYTPDPNDTTSVCLDWNHPALEVMRRRAEAIGNIQWTPLGEVPKRSGIFPKGVEVKGIPYSSVKELDKFIGQEVSFYTFLSAVSNPRSVLYTENVGESPYKGKNCAAYYGSVCSMTVNYALGLDRPYGTFMYGTLPFMKRVAKQDLDHAGPGDLIHFLYGHVILITNITKDIDGNAKSFNYLECTGSSAFNKKYTKQQLQNRLDKHEHVIYRYTNLEKLALEQSPFPAIEASLNENTAKAISLSRGDRVTYSVEDDIVINILERGYNRLEVYKTENGTDVIVEDLVYEGTPDIELDGLVPGCYKASLVGSNGNRSEEVSFEILQTGVDLSFRAGNIIDIRFNSINALPEYIVFCKENGGRRYIADISEEERLSGHKLVKFESSLDNLFLKVFFRGDYGRVSNHIIPLK